MSARNLRRRLIGRRGDDSGATLIEVVVTMTIMSVFLGMFTTGIIQIHRSMAAQESMDDAQSRINVTFQRLDKELRYAYGFSVPEQSAATGGIPYVEVLTAPNGIPVCTQLRVLNATLEMRTWDPGASAPTDGTWRSLLSPVTPVSEPALQPVPSTQAGPYAFWKADSTRVHQRLRLSLRATVGKDWNRASRETAITFTALNSTAKTDSSLVCPALRPAS